MSGIDHFRACGRRRVDLTARMQHRSSSEQWTVRVSDLSLRGACVEVGQPLAPGTPVSIEIVAPTLWDPLVLHGNVVWTRTPRSSPARAGVRFASDDASRLYALFELLDSLDYGD
jgi:hypothetical protein